MKKISNEIVFFGTDNFSLVPLRDLIGAGFNISAVVTKPDTKSGRGQKIEQPAVKRLAIAKQITVLQPNELSEITDHLSSIHDAIGVVVSYGKIIPDQVINLFRLGMVNVHPSLLPIYRGPSPIESAILNDDKHTGVTLMKLTNKMDAGPIYSQEETNLSGHETKTELRDKLSVLGSELLIKMLPHIINGDIKPSPQDETKATYSKMLSKTDGNINQKNITATEAERMIRAYLGFPKTRATILGHSVIVTKAHVEKAAQSPTDIVFYDGSVLSIDELVAPSGRKINSHEFINGYGQG
jgi:methionyl-tRNA formyltransferase